MSTAAMTSPAEVQPQRPWAVKRSARMFSAGKLLVFAVVAFGITLITPLANVDGWAIAFLLVNLVWNIGVTSKLGVKERNDALLRLTITSLGMLAFVPWLSIFVSVILKGYRALYPGYFVGDMRVTTPDDEFNMGGAGHAIVGSLIMVAIATVVTLPLGILSGIYLTEVRGRLTFLVRFIVQSMAGVPSVVAGLFIFATVVQSMGKYSGLAGGLALAVLMLPTVSRTAEEILKLVPDDLRNAGYALGARQWRTAIMVVLPTVRAGLITAAILGIARVIGETAPLLLTSLNTNGFVFNPIGGTVASLPTYIFSMFVYGTEYSTARAWTGSLVLLAFVLSFFLLARRLGGRTTAVKPKK
ncbi:MAG: phosphate ABC transporter permease PstA [Ilumatobacteraceae bacterium]